MALLIHYEGLQHFNDKWKDEERNQADELGHVLMATGVYEISEKTIS